MTSFVHPMLVVVDTNSCECNTHIVDDKHKDTHCRRSPSPSADTMPLSRSPSPSSSLASIPHSPPSINNLPSNEPSNVTDVGSKDSMTYSDIVMDDQQDMPYKPYTTDTARLEHDHEPITADLICDILNDTCTEAETTANARCECECDVDINIEQEQTQNIEPREPSVSISMSQCRYCYNDLARKCNMSQCHCSGILCRECLVKELQLTHGRADSRLQCTVCKQKYEVQTEFTFNCSKDCASLCGSFLIHCGLKEEQYLLDSVGGRVGFFLVILGINTWIFSTSLLFAFPPNGCPIELYYMVSIFDFAVGVSTIWFILKCRYLSPLFLSMMYFVRFVYLLLGWTTNLCNIYVYHDHDADHISILSYFLLFSFTAAMIMMVCWIVDFRAQYTKYRKEHGKLILAKNDIKIEIDNIVQNNEADSF